MKNKIVEFMKDEGGQTSTEYILLVVVVVMMIMKFRTKLEGKLNALTDSAFNKVDGELTNMKQDHSLLKFNTLSYLLYKR